MLGVGENVPDLAHSLTTPLHGGRALPITPLPVHLAPLAVLGAKLLHSRPTLLRGELAQLRAKLPHPLPHLRRHLRPLPIPSGALTAPLCTRLAVCLTLLGGPGGQLLELRPLLGGELERVGVREDPLGRPLPAGSVGSLCLRGDPHREQG